MKKLSLAMIVKKYPVPVDLARYHFLAVRMTHSGTYMALAVNGSQAHQNDPDRCTQAEPSLSAVSCSPAILSVKSEY